jgi:hypothetical protein
MKGLKCISAIVTLTMRKVEILSGDYEIPVGVSCFGYRAHNGSRAWFYEEEVV